MNDLYFTDLHVRKIDAVGASLIEFSQILSATGTELVELAASLRAASSPSRSTDSSRFPETRSPRLQTRTPNLRGESLEGAVLATLEHYHPKDFDAEGLTRVIQRLGYASPRAKDPKQSVANTLARLCREGKVERVSVGRYALPSNAALSSPGRHQPPDDGADTADLRPQAALGSPGQLVGAYWEDIRTRLASLQRAMPYVGLTLFRDRHLPGITGLDRGGCQMLIDDMRDRGLVEIYHVDHPTEADRQTAAIRLTDADIG